MAKEASSRGIPHTGKDCVVIKRNGVSVAYACYYHAEEVIALKRAEDIDAGIDPSTVDYSRWGIRVDTFGVPIPMAGINCCII